MKVFGAVIIGLLSIFLACGRETSLPEREARVQEVLINSKGQIEFQVESSPEYYYVLFGREKLDENSMRPLSVAFGKPGITTLTEPLRAYPVENYIVMQYEINNPHDLDNDGLSDVEELNDLGVLSPLNPSDKVNMRDGATCIADRAMFEDLSYEGGDVKIDTHLRDLEFVKFYILDANTDNPKAYFMNTVTHRGHGGFSRAIGLDGGFGGRGGRGRGLPGTMRGEIVYHPYATAPNGLPGVYRFEFEPNDSYSFEEVKLGYELLAVNMPFLENNWVYYPMPNAALPRYYREKELYDDSRVAIFLEEDIYKDVNFISLNMAEGYGFLRLMNLDERPNSRDIVVYESLPNEMPRVGGIITTVPQTPLSHVNLRAIQDNVPNAYVKSATMISSIADLVGKYVYYKVSEDGYEIREASSSEVDAYYQDVRPVVAQIPVRDLSVKEITALDNINFEQSSSFGVKAANLASMRSFGLPTTVVPNGFAIPFYFYDEFMKYNKFYERVQEMLDSPEFQEDYNVQESALAQFRDSIKNGEVPVWMMDAFSTLQASFTEDTTIRFRSSTNNEDLPGFSGAGLYDSKTFRPEETHIYKTVLEIYASLWNFRAFDERQFYKIDHMKAAMGVLVHPSFSNELANGVAVTTDPLYQTRNTYYLNTQIGEDLVTNPNARSIPEEVLLNADKSGSESYTLIKSSNQIENGELIMSIDQLNELRTYLTTIRDKFRSLYNISSTEEFIIEIEFKVTSNNHLAIKQARPWISNF